MGFLYLLLGLAILQIAYRTPTVRGRVGERLVSRRLAKLDPTRYRLISNLLIRGADGQTSQIDHVVVSCYGLFVIEVKHYQGYIFGKDSDLYWTVALNKHRRHKMYNPIRQNDGHVKALQSVMQESPVHLFHPIVVFTGSATLKVNTISDVVYLSGLNKLIKSFSHELLSTEEMATIYNRLFAANVMDKQALREHAARVRRLSRSK